MKKTPIAALLALFLAAGAAQAEFKDFTVDGELVTKAEQDAYAKSAMTGAAGAHAMTSAWKRT